MGKTKYTNRNKMSLGRKRTRSNTCKKRKHSNTKRKQRSLRGKGNGNGKNTPGDNLMNMLHENSLLPNREKKYTREQIAQAFDKVKEDDLYHSILRKKPKLNENERKLFFREAQQHQEDPSRISRIPDCKYGSTCRRINPVHKLAHSMGMYHPASLVAFSMTSKEF